MHRHFCDAEGHDWQCSGDCECICGLPIEGHDHSECPVELRPCPEHTAEFQRRMAQACSPEAEAKSKRLREKWEARPPCECGCASNGPGEIVGWCLHCDHVYADWSLKLQDRHFAQHCPRAPEALKQAARARFARHAP
jgi:hypothetical protein